MLGSDVVGGGANMGSELLRYKPLLDAISENPSDTVRRNLARDNFVSLITDQSQRRHSKMQAAGLGAKVGNGLTGLVLQSNYEFEGQAHTGAPQRSFFKDNLP